MSLIDDRKARLTAATFRQWGVPALWNGQAVTVIEKAEDKELNIPTFGKVAARGRCVFVQPADVGEPVKGDIVTLGAGSPAEEELKVFSEPTLNRAGVWTCEIN